MKFCPIRPLLARNIATGTEGLRLVLTDKVRGCNRLIEFERYKAVNSCREETRQLNVWGRPASTVVDDLVGCLEALIGDADDIGENLRAQCQQKNYVGGPSARDRLANLVGILDDAG